MRYVFSSVLLIALGCGDNREGATTPDAGGPDAAPDADRCGALTLGTPRLHYNLFNQLTGLQYPIVDGAAAGQLLILELYDESTGGLPPLAPGTFDLATAPNSNLATCQHCVFIASEDPVTGLAVTHFQAAGTVGLTAVSDPFESIFSGSATAELVPVTVDETGTSTPVAGGACLRLPALTFDTTPTAAECTKLVDCPNELLQVCSPITQQCVEPECDLDNGGCAPGAVCVTQDPTAFSGACYESCDPGVATSCTDGFTCFQGSPQPGQGWCVRAGAGTLGAACEVAEASTSCVDDLICSRESETCTSRCNLFGPGPACSSDTRCSLFGRCEPPTIADPAELGALCTGSATLATPCAVTATELAGYCFAFREQDPLRCVEACLDDDDCAASQFCALRFSSGLGECLPDPACGDGVLGEAGETCDDGNTVNGDTCSADCQTVDVPRSCATATPIASGIPLAGNTATGLDGFQSSCQFGRARTALFAFDPPTAGRLTVAITSATMHAVAATSDCTDATGELGCNIIDPNTSGTLVQQLVTGAPITIAVAAATVLDEGAFTITVSFVPEQCGDGIIAGGEVCDDGNTTANDGCSANCRTIEYGAYCAAAPVLSTTAPNVGDTTTAPFIYENNCSGFITGRDRLYRFTAPQAGTLHLVLEQGALDLGLAVFSGCGAPATMTELACSSVLGPDELADVPLAAGESVTVVVDGFDQGDFGPYTLRATFQ